MLAQALYEDGKLNEAIASLQQHLRDLCTPAIAAGGRLSAPTSRYRQHRPGACPDFREDTQPDWP